MQERTLLPISISFRDENAIKRVKNVYPDAGYSHAAIYMLGVAQVEKELEKKN